MVVLGASDDPDAVGSDRDWKVRSVAGRFVSFVPGSTFEVAHREYRHQVHIDELGGRRVLPASRARELTVCLGDSFAFGIGVAEGETFIDALQSATPRRVLNLSVPGSALPDQRYIMESRSLELGSPDEYLVFLFLGNDLEGTLAARQRWSGPSAGGQPRVDQAPTVYQRVTRTLNHSVTKSPLRRVYSLQYFKRSLMQLTSDSRRDPVYSIMDVGRVPERLQVETALAAELDEWNSLIRRQDLRVTFVMIPDVAQVSDKVRFAQARYYGLDPAKVDPTLPNRIVAEALKARQLRFLDATEYIAAAERVDDLYFPTDHHLTIQGHRRAAEYLVPRLQH
jgi:hypothetical protein